MQKEDACAAACGSIANKESKQMMLFCEKKIGGHNKYFSDMVKGKVG